MKRRAPFSLALVAVGAMAGGAMAQDAATLAELQAGRAVAVRVCASCHTIPDPPRRPILKRPAPAFKAIADSGASARSVTAYLESTHKTLKSYRDMPSPKITDVEAQAVADYHLELFEGPVILGPDVDLAATLVLGGARGWLQLPNATGLTARRREDASHGHRALRSDGRTLHPDPGRGLRLSRARPRPTASTTAWTRRRSSRRVCRATCCRSAFRSFQWLTIPWARSRRRRPGRSHRPIGMAAATPNCRP